jgi:anaphase-promoting complex subunit 1
MASVISLGLHQPTGLQYATQEHLLPSDPPSTSYDWHNHHEVNGESVFDEDELLVTPRSVIWSRGGVFRKCYKFDLEKEEVSQALLTSFPSVGPLESKSTKDGSKKGVSKRSAAIVVFLKTQAHVYFLSGTSHVIHLPFEVELAIAAPNGIIIQRKLRVDNLIAASLKFPKVPPNSFVASSQPQPWSASSSQLSTFSIADFAAPKKMSLQFNSTLKDLWDPPALKDDAKWPRLFSLSDPLSELGLVAAQPSKSELKGQRRGSIKLATLDISEEILHISPRGAFDQGSSDQPFVLALTLNRETSVYTVWKMAYISEDTLSQKRRVSSDPSRRRSSFMPGTATGATTPVMNNQATFRESFGVAPAAKGGAKQADGAKEKTVDFVSALDTEWNGSTVTRRKSRRVSSMLARADLSANHERSAFTELATSQQHTSNRRGESLGSQHGRTSLGVYPGVSGPSLNQPPQFGQSLNSLLEAPIDDLLDELRAGGDFEGFHNMGLDDDEFDSLRQEVVLTKVCSVNAEHSNVRYSSQHMPAKSQCKVFMLTAPMSAADERLGNSIVICILDSDEQKLVVLTLHRKIHTSVNHESSIRGKKREKDVNVLSLAPVVRAGDVLDACRLNDGQISRILVLTKTPDGYGELSLQAPWSSLMKIPLPGKFTISNIRDLGHDATPRARREGGFKRVLSQGPRALRGLRNSKPHGHVDLVDDENKLHQLQIRLEAQNPHVRKVLSLCRAVLPGQGGGESVVVAWWKVMQWLRLESIDAVDAEWMALVITLFSLFLSLSMDPRQGRNTVHKRKKSRAHLRSSSGVHSDTESWQEMLAQESTYGDPLPSWANNPAWQWLAEESNSGTTKDNDLDPVLSSQSDLQRHLRLAREFATSSFGESTVSSDLPTSRNKDPNERTANLVDLVIGLHLIREEEKLNTMTADSFSVGVANLAPVLGQIVKWLRWSNWSEYYSNEDASLLDVVYDTGKCCFLTRILCEC